MIHFLPNEQPPVAAEVHSLHGKLNRALEAFGVVCTGRSGDTLYFDLKSREARKRNPDELGQDILNQLLASPELMDWIRRESITSITLR